MGGAPRTDADSESPEASNRQRWKCSALQPTASMNASKLQRIPLPGSGEVRGVLRVGEPSQPEELGTKRPR